MALALPLAGCIQTDGWPGSAYRETFHYSCDLRPGGRVHLENFNGPVEISGWDFDKVEIDGEKYASSPEELKDLRIETRSSPDQVEIFATRPRGGWLFSGSGARFTVRVPRMAVAEHISTSNGRIDARDLGAGADLRTTNGRIQGEAIRGELDARTSNGAIDMREVDGAGSFKTSNGSITLSLSRGPVDTLRMETSNGRISLRLPTDAAAHVDASTSNGSISNEFILAIPRVDKHHVSGNIGSGGPQIRLSTTNGSIRILRD